MAVSFDFKKRLGSGYFGEVWFAMETGLDCQCAVKRIPPSKIINEKNFYQEAQTLKRAEHPNIVKVLDTGNLDNGDIYVSMEYLPAGSLENEASGAFLPLKRAKRLMIDVLRGLEHAHRQGILHRDIKPANILVGNSQEGKLSDFGLAVPDPRSLNIDYIKKYQYLLHLAPEVRDFLHYTRLSDIYACGATLYRLVNGDAFVPRPNTADDLYLLVQAGKFPPRDRYREFVPVGLRRLINKALNVDPAGRFQPAEEMRHAIERQEFHVEWQETVSRRGIVWHGIAKDFEVEIAVEQGPSGSWTVETRRGKAPSPLRRVTKCCSQGLSRLAAYQLARKLLQTLTCGKKIT